MGVVYQGRRRLTSGFVAVAAIAAFAASWSGEANAQRSAPAVNCAPYGAALPNRISERAITTGETASVTQSIARIAAYEADPRRVTLNEIEMARAACTENLGGRNQFNLPAYTCVARANAIFAASQNTVAAHEASACGFERVARLAELGRAPAETIGAAQEGRANALMAVRRLEGPSRAVSLQTDALDAFQRAIAAPGATADRQRRLFARGRAYMEFAGGDHQNRANYTNLALADINAGAALGMTDEAALTLVELSQSPGVDAIAVLDPLSSRDTLAVQTALGMAYYNRYAANAGAAAAALRASPPDTAQAQALTAEAQRYLQAARTPIGRAAALAATAPAPTSPDLGDFRAEANYYAALVDAADGAWPSAYDRARRASAAPARFKQLACLSVIARGWSRLENEAAASSCDVSGDATGNLVRGMFHLRRAQYINPGEINPGSARRQAYMDEMRAAVSAFNAGLSQVSASNDPDQIVTLPSYPEGFNLRHALTFGRQVVAPTCSGPREAGLAIDPVAEDVRATGLPMYRRYNLHLCDVDQQPR